MDKLLLFTLLLITYTIGLGQNQKFPGSSVVNPSHSGFPTQKTYSSPLGATADDVSRNINKPAYKVNSSEQIKELRKILDEEKAKAEADYYASPIFTQKIKHYSNALAEMKGMLEGKSPLELKRAVFLVENAYYDNKLNYEDYSKKIDELILFCRSALNKNGFQETDKVAKNLVLYKLYTETLERIDSKTQATIKHHPVKYNFNDFWGTEDWANQFVVKLLYTNKGQCHSLPLLYLILAQEFGTEAYLSFSPNHSYIRFKDYHGSLYNFETTNGHMVSDKWIMGSQYIKSEAVRNGLYMDTLNYKEVVANCLNDLADGFQIKFGLADGKFLLESSDLSLKHYSRGNYHAFATKSNLYFGKFDLLRRYNGVERSNEAVLRFLSYNPKAKEYWDLHDKYYNEIRSMGYEDMPQEKYAAWLKSVEVEKEKIEHNKIMSKISKKGK